MRNMKNRLMFDVMRWVAMLVLLCIVIVWLLAH